MRTDPPIATVRRPAARGACHCCPRAPGMHARSGRGAAAPVPDPPQLEPCWAAATGRAGPRRRVQTPLNLLLDDTVPLPESLVGAVSEDTKHGRVIEVVVDSGAVHSVAPPSRFPGQMSSSPWSRAGRSYRAANGTSIKNLGQLQVTFDSREGHRCHIPFQVANVEQPLISVAHLASAGNKVELGPKDGRIYNTNTGREMKLEKRGGVYLLKMWVTGDTAPPFRRQGA